MTPSARRLFGTAALAAAALLAGCTAATGASAGPTEAGSSHAAAAGPSGSTAAAAAADAANGRAATAAFRALETKYGASLGVSAVDTKTNRNLSYNATERFNFASTYKALAAGILLEKKTDAQLAATVHYTSADLVDYSPITEQHVGTGMTLSDIIAAALQYSDNTAANLMLAQLGGPAALTKDLRALGDSTTNVNDTEPAVNTATPGDPNNTTTPKAIGVDLRAFVLGDALSPSRRATLENLMIGNTTGGPYIRAGVPTDWAVGDKTGNGGYGTRNDIAVVWRPSGSPLVISILTHRHTADATSDDALIADATRVVTSHLP